MDHSKWKLYHPETRKVLVEVIEDKVIFHNAELKKTLLLNGITIPFSMKDEFGGERLIYPDDSGFAKAFVEVYYPYCLHENGFILQKS